MHRHWRSLIPFRGWNFMYHVLKFLIPRMELSCSSMSLYASRVREGHCSRSRLHLTDTSLSVKARWKRFLLDLPHGGQVYKLLRRVQGSATPVCLGNIDLKRMYYLDIGVKTIHMLPIS